MVHELKVRRGTCRTVFGGGRLDELRVGGRVMRNVALLRAGSLGVRYANRHWQERLPRSLSSTDRTLRCRYSKRTATTAEVTTPPAGNLFHSLRALTDRTVKEARCCELLWPVDILGRLFDRTLSEWDT